MYINHVVLPYLLPTFHAFEHSLKPVLYPSVSINIEPCSMCLWKAGLINWSNAHSWTNSVKIGDYKLMMNIPHCLVVTAGIYCPRCYCKTEYVQHKYCKCLLGQCFCSILVYKISFGLKLWPKNVLYKVMRCFCWRELQDSDSL